MSCTTTRRINATLNAVEGRWGRSQCRTWTTLANTANALEDTYLDLNLIGYDFLEDKYIVWFNGGTGSAPTVTGATNIEVTITSGDSASVVASAIKTAIDAEDIPCFVTVSGSVVTIENQVQGEITAETDLGSTGFTLEVGTVGLSVELGATSGPVSVSYNTEEVPITSNQTASLNAGAILVGSSVEVEMSLIEITKERYDTLVGETVGGNITPAAGTKVSGIGESKLFQALDGAMSGQLILHPIRLDDADKSEDFVVWRCTPKVQSQSFDGAAISELPVTFTAYLDRNVSTAVNMAALGNWTQKGLRA